MIIMKKKIYLAMLAVCFALTASACGDGGAVITDGTKTEGAADGKKAETGTTRLVSVENVEKYITIGEYKGLTLDNTVDAITDDDVQAQIDENLKDKAEPVSDAAKEGDLVTVNYTGTKDGQTFDGGTANNYDFVIGDGQMFEEFENGVIGMKKGDTKEIKIDFPSDYADETLAGKEVIYKVTVQNVRREGELTDEWVAKNTDYTTVDDYRESIRSELEKNAKEYGESITLVPYQYHEFIIPEGGPSLIGEVSMVNDDHTDNFFYEPLGRFPTIEEDEAPYRLLCTEYPEAK